MESLQILTLGLILKGYEDMEDIKIILYRMALISSAKNCVK